MKEESFPLKEARLRLLLKELGEHDELYYRLAKPKISDQKYDQLKRELEQLSSELDPLGLFPTKEKSSNNEADPKGVLVGDDRVDGFKSHTHKEAMLSLDNTYDENEFFEFDKRLRKVFGNIDLDYVVEPKIDGVAVSLSYREGELECAVTRGNGVTGDVITQNLLHIPELPRSINALKYPDFIEVRGEIYMEHEEFTRINQEKEEKNLPTYANPRNLAAGTVKLLDPKEAKQRQLRMVLYGLGACEPVDFFKSQIEFHKTIAEWSFPTVEFVSFVPSASQAWEEICKLDKLRHGYAYPTDGAVIKLDSRERQKTAGHTAKAPRWAISYKFESERQTTVLEDIIIQVGRTGAITPVACLAPVQLAGTLVSRASLHNADEIERKDIRIGDHVLVEKAGEIIPQVVEVVEEYRSNTSVPFSFPSACPVCETSLARIEGESAWRCPNYGCPDQLKGKIEYFASRGCMDIENLGSAVVEQLVDLKLVTRLDDLYRLEHRHLLELDGFAEKSARNLINAIENSKTQEFWRIICGLGIKHVGSSASKELAKNFTDWNVLSKATAEDFIAIEGIGSIMAHSLVSFFQSPENLLILESMENFGVLLKSKSVEGNFSPWEGQIFVLTGSLKKFSRLEASKSIENLGGRVSSSISKKTNFLVAGPGAGSKLVKAEDFGVSILTEEEFISFIEKPDSLLA